MGFIMNYGTPHSPLIWLIWNLQDVLIGVWLMFIQNLKLFWQSKILCEIKSFKPICDILNFYGPEIVQIYSTDHNGPEIYGNIQEKQCYGPVIIKL